MRCLSVSDRLYSLFLIFERSVYVSVLIKTKFLSLVTNVFKTDKDCGNPSVRLPGHSEPIPLDVNFNKAEVITTRTFIILVSYAVTSSLWVVASLAVITTLCGPITRTVTGLCFCPWFIIVMAGSILDAVATGFHIHDIMNTTVIT